MKKKLCFSCENIKTKCKCSICHWNTCQKCLTGKNKNICKDCYHLYFCKGCTTSKQDCDLERCYNCRLYFCPNCLFKSFLYSNLCISCLVDETEYKEHHILIALYKRSWLPTDMTDLIAEFYCGKNFFKL